MEQLEREKKANVCSQIRNKYVRFLNLNGTGFRFKWALLIVIHSNFSMVKVILTLDDATTNVIAHFYLVIDYRGRHQKYFVIDNPNEVKLEKAYVLMNKNVI